MLHHDPSGSRSRGHDTVAPPTTLAGLWVLLVSNDGELAEQDADGRVPVIARAGNDQMYLLVFKNIVKAREFMAATQLTDATPRMVVRGNHSDLLRIAKSANVVGTLLDYDPVSQKFAATGPLA